MHIEHLSLAYNRIENYKELLKIENKDNIKSLRIVGNPMEDIPNIRF